MRHRQKMTDQDHRKAADILTQIQALIDQLGNIPGAVNVRQKLRVQKAVQERLIDPLREDWDEGDHPYLDEPYPNVHYGV